MRSHVGRLAARSAALVAAVVLSWPGLAAPGKSGGGGSSLLPGANSKEPVNIDAGKLDYFDKEQKLVYTGDVVAVQGETTLKASILTIFLQRSNPDQAGAPAPAAAGPAPGAGSSVKHMEADGPVTMISKDQVGTGDHATYDKAENKIYLIGNVTLSQGTNITQGDRLVYDLTTTRAQVFSGNTTARVKSVFTPGSAPPGGAAADATKPDASADATKKDKPATRRKAASRKATTASDAPVDQ